MPDFLVVGAARAGTTTLHSYLRQHTELFLPEVKEPSFFVFDGDDKKYEKGKFAFAVRDAESYEKLFSKALPGQKMGEISTPYLYLYEKTIASLKKYFSAFADIKIVIMLRNPAKRAFSQYCWRVRDGREPLDFETAIEAEGERMKANFSFDYFYLDRGFYYKQVRAFMENFKHVHIILFEDFEKDPFAVLKDLCRFLEVDENFEFKKLLPQNESALPRSKAFGRMITAENKLKFKIWYAIPDKVRKKIRSAFTRLNAAGKTSMDPEMHRKLLDIYRDDILSLQKLTGLDLSRWIQ